jgi:hypothetical protein
MRAQRKLLVAMTAAALALAGDTTRAETPQPGVAASKPWPTMREHPVDVVDYTLKASLDPDKHTVHGEGTITWRNTSSVPATELWIHLYLNAFKNQSSVFMREPIGGFRGTTVPAEWGTIDVRRFVLAGDDLWPKAELTRKGDTDETDVRVPLSKPIAPGETVTIDTTWDDTLPTIVERTGHDGSFHMVAQWFPKVARLEPDGTWAHFPFHHLAEFYADYGTYDVTVDVPESFTIGASGPVIDEKTVGGRRVEHHVQKDVHDFAWTAWDKFQKRKETIDGVDVTILYPPSYDGHAERELQTMRFALPHYGARYGKYPYSVLTLVHPPQTAPEAGGMEYPTLITTGGSWATPRGMHFDELVTIHEFGHQYFYGLLGSNEEAWPFLDEGLNSFAEEEAMRAWKGAGSAVDFMGLKIGDGMAHAERARTIAHDAQVAQPAPDFVTGTAYGALVYSRTAAILETMRRVYGPAAMERTMGVYARRFRFEHPKPEDLITAFRDEMGPAQAETLRAALFDKGWVDYTVTQVSSHAAHPAGGIFDVNGKRETMPSDKWTAGRYEGWALVLRRGTLQLPVDIELVADDGTRTRTQWDGAGDSIRVPYAGASPLRSAIVDPDSKVLLDQDPMNDFATAPGRSGGSSFRMTERATWWAELLLGAIGP